MPVHGCMGARALRASGCRAYRVQDVWGLDEGVRGVEDQGPRCLVARGLRVCMHVIGRRRWASYTINHY